MRSTFAGWIVVLVLAAVCAPVALGSEPALAEGILREQFMVDFDGFPARGELTYPATGNGPFPTVVLVHGSGPSDMDNTVTGVGLTPEAAAPVSTIFRDIAEHLSSHGFAVVRYNKRFVNGPNDFDYVRYITEVDLHTLAADLETVVRFAKNHPLVDAGKLFLYGWSEGSTVATHVAVNDAEYAGLILQTPVATAWRETFEYQVYDVGVPYLRLVAGGGTVTDDTVLALLADDGAGQVATSIANFVADGEAFQMGHFAVNRMLDQNGDGQLDIDTEVVPGLPFLLDFAFGPFGPFAMYAPERSLPVVGEQVDHLNVPVLILQGAQDANVPAAATIQLAEKLKEVGVDVTLHVYEELGHSLGPASSPMTDTFAPIDQQPLEDVVAWLQTFDR